MSDLPRVLGLCQTDVAGVANAVNTAQRRLLYAKEAGDESWNGTWAEMAFTVSRSAPYLVTPREVARLEYLTVCDRPVPIHNQFYEYLTFGNGRLPKTCFGRRMLTQVFSRNNSVLFRDLGPAPQLLRIYLTNPADKDKRVLIQGKDTTDSVILSQDGQIPIIGQFVTLDVPFATFPMQLNSIDGIQKDITLGPVQIKQVDPTTGNEVLLLTMEPGEQTAQYRRYYFDSLPAGCCPDTAVAAPCSPNTATSQVTALAKLELIPVRVDTDYCLIQNLEAIIEEAQSARYSRIDTVAAKQMAADRHTQAIRLLNGELTHLYGLNDVAVSFLPFGSARLECQKIGTLL